MLQCAFSTPLAKKIDPSLALMRAHPLHSITSVVRLKVPHSGLVFMSREGDLFESGRDGSEGILNASLSDRTKASIMGRMAEYSACFRTVPICLGSPRSGPPGRGIGRTKQAEIKGSSKIPYQYRPPSSAAKISVLNSRMTGCNSQIA